jgi:hypothetical protein
MEARARAALHPLGCDFIAQQSRVEACYLLCIVLAAYRELESACDVVMCEGVSARQGRCWPRAAAVIDVADSELLRVEGWRV